MTTTVINHKQAPEGWQDDPQYVYIGRAMPRYGLKASKWANPFKIGMDNLPLSRFQALYKYMGWLVSNPNLLLAIPELKNKTLVCWCAPKPCHGDILKLLVDAWGQP